MGRQILRYATLALAVGVTAGCAPVVYDTAQPSSPPPVVEPAPPLGVEGDAAFFYDALVPYGSWVIIASFGQVWVPRVPPWWRPYTEGRWAYTDAGWTWVEIEPFGWAVYHYGRWYWDAEYGWAWVPGTVWAPAWVAWRSGGGHIGWAPMPPSVRWEAGVGSFSRGVDFDAVIAPERWCFVEEQHITAPTVREYVMPPARNVTFVNVTNNITNYTVVDNRIVNNSVSVDHVERVTHAPVPRYHIVDRESPAALHGQSLQANEIPMVRRIEKVQTTRGGSTAVTRVTSRPGSGTSQPLTGGQPYLAPTATVTSTAGAPKVESVDEVQHRHELETKELQTRHDNDRARLQQIHQAEVSQAPPNLTAEQLKGRHLAELQALEAQHRSEVQVLAKRHQRELDAAKAKMVMKPALKPVNKPKRKLEGDNERP